MAEIEQMYVVQFKANPHLDSDKFGKISVSFCTYWVKAKDREDAGRKAIAHAANKGWIATGVAEIGFTNRDMCPNDPTTLAAFDYATATGISGVIDGYDANPPQNN